MKPDVYIKIRFKTPSEGGRSSSITGEYYSCPLFVDGEAFECRLLIAGQTLQLGNWYELPVKFMNSELALSKLNVNKIIKLWEGKDIAEGVILSIEK